MKNFTTNNWLSFICFVIIFIIICVVALSGCEVIKGKRSISSDSTAVKKEILQITDTSKGGSVKTNTTKEEFDWYKMTQLFDQKKQTPGDTKVYPTTVIYEGGKGTKESSTVDSSWFLNALNLMQANLDSTNKKLQESEKNKKSETKGVGLIFIILICVGCIVLYAILSGYLKRFKIVKK